MLSVNSFRFSAIQRHCARAHPLRHINFQAQRNTLCEGWSSRWRTATHLKSLTRDHIAVVILEPPEKLVDVVEHLASVAEAIRCRCHVLVHWLHARHVRKDEFAWRALTRDSNGFCFNDVDCYSNFLRLIWNTVYRKKSFPSKESDTKILQSIYFAFEIGIIGSYSNRIYRIIWKMPNAFKHCSEKARVSNWSTSGFDASHQQSNLSI